MERAAAYFTGLVLSLLMVQAWIPPYPIAYNGPSWAMSVFVFIYSLFPFLIKWMRKQGLRHSFYLTAAIWLLSQIVNHWLFNLLDPEMLQQLMPVILWNPLLEFNSFLIGAFTEIVA